MKWVNRVMLAITVAWIATLIFAIAAIQSVGGDSGALRDHEIEQRGRDRIVGCYVEEDGIFDIFPRCVGSPHADRVEGWLNRIETPIFPFGPLIVAATLIWWVVVGFVKLVRLAF